MNYTISALEAVLMKLILKQKKLQYEIARLEYRIYSSQVKLEAVSLLIAEEEENIASYQKAISSVPTGKVMDQLVVLKTKAEFRLFKLGLRTNKIDIVKLIINQSKLDQFKSALISVESSITQAEKFKKQTLSITVTAESNESHFTNPVNSIKMPQRRKILKMASLCLFF